MATVSRAPRASLLLQGEEERSTGRVPQGTPCCILEGRHHALTCNDISTSSVIHRIVLLLFVRRLTAQEWKWPIVQNTVLAVFTFLKVS